MVAFGSAKLLFFLIFPSHWVTFEFNPNRVSGEAIHDGVSQGWFIDVVIPFWDRKLWCHNHWFPDEKEKRKYLQGLFSNFYIKDIVERYKLRYDNMLSALVDVLSSSIGSLTNPNKLANTAGSLMGKSPSHNTIKNYLDYVEDAFLFQSAKRWDVKGRKYFDTIQKYYAMDLGLRNARLNFRQQEHSHLMENMIYNDLIRRGYSVDVGIVELSRVIEGKRKMSQYEIDYVVNVGNDKVYIQSALNVDTPEKKAQETFSLRNTGDFFR